MNQPVIDSEISLQSKLPEGVYVWGTGRVGRKARSLLEPAGFIDSDVATHGQTVDGLEVLAPSILMATPGAEVVIASSWCVEIHEAAVALGVSADSIWGYSGDRFVSPRTFAKFILGALHRRAFIESYRNIYMGGSTDFGLRREEFLRFSCNQSRVAGAILEFGVFEGDSLRALASCNEAPVYGFDSFEGLPERWGVLFPPGSYRAKQPQGMPENVELIKGWFSDSLPKFLEEFNDDISVVHLDADLYSSTVTVLELLKGYLKPGVVLIFDEYFSLLDPFLSEFNAFQEFVESGDLSYDYIASCEGGRVALVLR